MSRVPFSDLGKGIYGWLVPRHNPDDYTVVHLQPSPTAPTTPIEEETPVDPYAGNRGPYSPHEDVKHIVGPTHYYRTDDTLPHSDQPYYSTNVVRHDEWYYWDGWEEWDDAVERSTKRLPYPINWATRYGFLPLLRQSIRHNFPQRWPKYNSYSDEYGRRPIDIDAYRGKASRVVPKFTNNVPRWKKKQSAAETGPQTQYSSSSWHGTRRRKARNRKKKRAWWWA